MDLWVYSRENGIYHMRIQRGEQGVRTPPPEKSQEYRVSKHSMLGHHRHTRETPFKWRLAGGPMMSRFQLYFDPLIN